MYPYIYRLPNWLSDIVDEYNMRNSIIDSLCQNIHAIPYLESHYATNEFNWLFLSSNINAISILEKNIDKIYWNELSSNTNALRILQRNERKIVWTYLSMNSHPEAIRMLQKNVNKIDWRYLSSNINAMDIIAYQIYPWYFIRHYFANICRCCLPCSYGHIYGNEICWSRLSSNPSATTILRNNVYDICWFDFSSNEGLTDIDIALLEKNEDEINWEKLSLNTNANAIYFLEQKSHRIRWRELSSNKNAIHLLQQNQHLIDWEMLSTNENAIDLLTKNKLYIDKDAIFTNKNGLPLCKTILLDRYNKAKMRNVAYLDDKQFTESYVKKILQMHDVFEKTINYRFIKQRMSYMKEELIAAAMHPRKITRFLDRGGDMDDF
jgi:hypothetical protein